MLYSSHSLRLHQHISIIAATCWGLCASSAYAATQTDSECFFNWAEAKVPSVLAPHQSTKVMGNLSYRFYPATQVYMLTEGTQALFFIGSELKNFGPLSSFLSAAQMESCGSTPPTRYSKVGNYPLTECVKDNVTGLIWEGKEATGTWAGTNTYTNRDNGGGGSYTSAQISATTNSIGYATVVNAAGTCGFTSGWRLPTKDELLTLVKPGSPPTIDMTWFPNTWASYVWTASPYVYSGGTASTTSAWYVNFSTGTAGYDTRSTNYGVRLVHTGQ
jgi:hypothetical protein